MLVAALLAVSDTATYTMWCVQLFYTAIVSVGVFILGYSERARRHRDELQAKSLADMQLRLDAAGNDGKALVEKLLEERLRAASHEVNNHVQSFVNGLELLKEKAAESAEEFKELNAADHENRLTIATQIGNLQKWMLEFFASKDDVRAIDQSVRTLEQKVAVVANQAERARRQ